MSKYLILPSTRPTVIGPSAVAVSLILKIVAWIYKVIPVRNKVLQFTLT
jgi:hypothetical protein